MNPKSHSFMLSLVLASIEDFCVSVIFSVCSWGRLEAGVAFQMLWGLHRVLEILAGRSLWPPRPSLHVALRTG